MDDDGEIDYIQGNYDPYLTITEAKQIIACLQRHIKRYKTDEYVELLNYKHYKESEEAYEEASRARRLEEKNKKPKPRPCSIYLLVDKFNGYYKIGRAVNLYSRLRQLVTANAAIQLVKGWDGANEDEKALHELFSEKRIGTSEWFSLTEQDFEAIEGYFKNKAVA